MLLFSLLISYKIYGEKKVSSGRSGVPCLHSRDDSYLTVRVSLSLQPYTSLAQEGKLSVLCKVDVFRKLGFFFSFANVVDF